MLKQHENLYVANGPCFRISSLKGNPLLVAMFRSWSFQSRGPWLPSRLCCPAGSRLTMTSSETLGPSCRLIFFVLAGLCPTVLYGLGLRGSPIYSACLFHRATSGTPALRLATNDRCITNRSGLRPVLRGSAHANPRRRFSRGCRNEATLSSLLLRPDGLLALLRQGRLLSSLRPHGLPQTDVEYNYTGKRTIPATGLSPVRHAALWAARGRRRV